MRNPLTTITLFIALSLLPAGKTKAQPLETVPYVDLARYAGTWYEIACYPQRFQRGCHCTTATYILSPKGHVVVEKR